MFSHVMLRRYCGTLRLSMMILPNLMSKTGSRVTEIKITTMAMMSENIDTDCFQYGFK